MCILLPYCRRGTSCLSPHTGLACGVCEPHLHRASSVPCWHPKPELSTLESETKEQKQQGSLLWATTYELWVPGKHPSLGGDRLDLLNLTHSFTWADISSCAETVRDFVLEDIRHISLCISNFTHVDFLHLLSFGMFYHSKFFYFSLLSQSTLSHSRVTALQMLSAFKWDVKPSGCRMASALHVHNTSTQSTLLVKLTGI